MSEAAWHNFSFINATHLLQISVKSFVFFGFPYVVNGNLESVQKHPKFLLIELPLKHTLSV